MSFSRLEKGGAATSVDITCTLLSDSMGSGLNREQLYWELSHETHGVTRLGPYTLDRNSLYVNGEGPCYSHDLSTTWMPGFFQSSKQNFV
jgi:hypothetical protein